MDQQCSACHLLKPPHAYFKGRKQCKECMLKAQKQRYLQNKQKYSAQQKEYRKQHAQAIKERRHKHYITHADQEKARTKAWTEANKEHVKKRKHAYYMDNREIHAKKCREYREANSEQRRLYVRQWRIENAEQEKVRHRAAYAANPAAYKARTHKRRLRQFSAEGHFTSKDIATLYKEQKHLCAYCFTSIEAKYHIDHRTPLTRGGTNWPSNLALACPTCDRRKYVMTADEFIALLATENNDNRQQ